MTTIPGISHALDDPCLLAGGSSHQSQWGERVSDDRVCWNLAEVK